MHRLFSKPRVAPFATSALIERLESRQLFAATVTDDPREVVDLQAAWKYFQGDVANASAVAFDDSTWTTLNLPHTWNAQDGQDGGDDYRRGISWYRKAYTVPEAYADNELFLKFDGASLVSDVYVNGNFVGRHEGGYAAFTFDVTAFMDAGAANVIAVKVNNLDDRDVAPISGPDVALTGPDFTIFGGLYRGVSLVVTDPLHVTVTDYAGPGVYLQQEKVTRQRADVDVVTKVLNEGAAARDVTVVADVLDADGNLVTRLTDTQRVAAGAYVEFSQDLTIQNPRLWNGTIDPYMYDVVVRVKDGDTVADLVQQPLGLRYFSIDPDQGFFLNGERYALPGVNMHQDRQDKGYAVSPDDIAEDIGLIEDIGAKMVRLVHYQHAEQTYDLLDEAGVVVWTEVPFIFDESATPEFSLNVKRQMRELIRQNFNHPSILFWGLFNALYEGEVASRLVPELDDMVRAEDPSRKTIAATAQRTLPTDALNHYSDVISVNDYNGWYRGTNEDFGTVMDTFHDLFPHRALGVAEYGAGANPAQHQEEPVLIDDEDELHPEEYQNEFHESHLRQIRERPYLWSTLVFNMFDFAADDRDEGGIPGRNDKGLVTYDRNIQKDSYFLYKSNWSDEPTVYISSRRDDTRNDGDVYVKIYSNLDSVELRVNGVSLGTKTGDEINVFLWDEVSLNAGVNVVEAIGTRNGQTVTDTVTWSTPVAGSGGIGGGGGDGLLGTYFNGTNFTDQRLTRVDPNVDFDWGAGSPSPLIASDAFSVRWTGEVLVGFSETYTFYTTSNDGVRLWVDGQLVIDKFIAGPTADYSGTIALQAGQKYDIVLEYFDNTGSASAQLSWSSLSRPKQVVPSARLFSV